MEAWALLYDVVLLLAVSLVLGAVCSRLRQTPLVGYLVAGMLLGGPGSFNLIQSERAIESIAELGVSLLLFSLGLEFSPRKVRRLGAASLLAGVLQVALTTALAAAAAWLLNVPAREAIALGAMISLSSTAVVLRLLMERAETESAHGRCSIAVLLVQDIAVLPLALLVVMIGGGTPDSGALGPLRTVVLAAVLVVALYVVVNLIAVRVLGTLMLERNRELTMIFAVVIGLGAAWGAHAAGISPALGAFIAGMFLGSSAFATQIRADISPLRVVLLTLFFGSAGMVADPMWILNNLPLVVGVSVALMFGKAAVAGGILAAVGHPLTIAVAGGLCLSQIGEFAFVLGSIGRSGGVLTEQTQLLIVSVAIVTLFISSLLVPAAGTLGARFAAWVRGTPAPSTKGAAAPPAPDVVIVGFGPAGRLAGEVFAGRPQRVLVIDLNRSGVGIAHRNGLDAHIGDATQFEVLEHANVAGAKAVVITIPHHDSALRILENVRRLAPNAHVVVRSRYQRHSDEYVSAGAHAVFGDEEQIGSRLGQHLREWLMSRGS